MSKKRSPELDNAPAYPDDSLLANLEADAPPMPPGPTTFHPPVEIERRIKAQRTHDETEWERQDA